MKEPERTKRIVAAKTLMKISKDVLGIFPEVSSIDVEAGFNVGHAEDYLLEAREAILAPLYSKASK